MNDLTKEQKELIMSAEILGVATGAYVAESKWDLLADRVAKAEQLAGAGPDRELDDTMEDRGKLTAEELSDLSYDLDEEVDAVADITRPFADVITECIEAARHESERDTERFGTEEERLDWEGDVAVANAIRAGLDLRTAREEIETRLYDKEEEVTGTEISRWADPAMFDAEPMDQDEDGQVSPSVYLLSANNDPLGSIAAACMMYEGKVCRWLGEITDQQRRHYWEQVQKTHLKAPLEFVDLHFMIEGVTRSFTHQMVRQRTAVYAQESLRFAVKSGFADEVPLPPSLVHLDPSDPEVLEWQRAIGVVEAAYQYLVERGVPAEDARGLLPHSVTTRLNYKTNLRNLLDHAGNRLCTQAQFEWREVFIEIVQAIRRMTSYTYVHPAVDQETDKDSIVVHEGDGYVAGSSGWQFELIATSNVFKPVCFELGRCPFTAVFDRDCTIRERVQEGKFEEIHPTEWMADPTAARRGTNG